MPLFRAGSLWLFRLAGIDVYVHWSWLIVAYFQVHTSARAAEAGNPLLPLYDAGMWHALQYLALFGIVLLHEFGHALACRQVGGMANTIVLWPLGGIAFVQPPQRPGACLWTSAAGPLVNVALIPVFGMLLLLNGTVDWSALSPDLPSFLKAVFWLNIFLLLFNLIPVYPLDGGQIFQAVLWFLIGRAESLMAASIVGMIVGGMVLLLAAIGQALWLYIMAAFVVVTAAIGFRHGLTLTRLLNGPRRKEAACPGCGFSPPIGNYWLCDECHAHFDTFHNRARCPECGKLFRETTCPECHQRRPVGEWFPATDLETQTK